MSNLNIIFDLLHYEGTNSATPADACKVKNSNQDVDIVDFIRYGSSIADATVDQVVPIADIASEYSGILVDREVSIKLNGGTEVHTLTPRGNGIKTLAFFKKGLTSLVSISNSSGAAANVDIITANK